MDNESRWRNSSSEVGIAEFPSSEPTIFPELPPFWFLFGGKSFILICRRPPFLRCCNADCCLIIASREGENRQPPLGADSLTPLSCRRLYGRPVIPARALKLSIPV